MNVIDDIPAGRDLPPGRADARRLALERETRGPARPPFRARRLAVVLASAAIVGAAAAYVAVSPPWGVSAAYASWTAVPGQLGPAATQALGASCAQSLQQHFKDANGLAPALGEQRGKFSAVVLGDAANVGVCVNVNGILGGFSTRSPIPAGSALVLEAAPGLLTGPDAARAAYGEVSPQVTRVVVTTQDGRTVTASVGGGYFLGWWPSGADPATIAAYDAAGAQLSRLTVPKASNGPPIPTHN